MSKVITNIIETLRAVAEDLPGVNNTRIAAAIVYKNRIMSIGYNQWKTHPFQAEYGKNEHAIWFHAETHAINNALKRMTERELKKSTMVVVRVKKDDDLKDTFGLAKPCRGCQKCIEEHQLKSVIYTVDSTFSKLSYTTETQ